MGSHGCGYAMDNWGGKVNDGMVSLFIASLFVIEMILNPIFPKLTTVFYDSKQHLSIHFRCWQHMNYVFVF